MYSFEGKRLRKSVKAKKLNNIIKINLTYKCVPCLIWGEHDVCHDEERPILRRRHYVVSLVPHPLVQVVPRFGKAGAGWIGQGGSEMNIKSIFIRSVYVLSSIKMK